MGRKEQIDLTYLRICREYSTLTRCLSRQVGALLVNPDGIVIGMGVNGPPRGVPHCPGPICPRKVLGLKGLETCPAVHAEVNAISACARTHNSTCGCTLYIYPIGPCGGCAAQIIQVGITQLVFPQSEWYDDLAPGLLASAGVGIRTYPIGSLAPEDQGL